MNLNSVFAGIFGLGVGVIIADSRKIYADGGKVFDEDDFDSWFRENKDSDFLKEDYENYKLDMKEMGEKSKSFKNWAKEFYESENYENGGSIYAKGGEVASSFFNDNPSKTHTANIHVVKDGQEIKIYSYDTVIAKRKIGEKTIELNTKKYSNTTTKLQNMLKREASEKGFSLHERGEF